MRNKIGLFLFGLFWGINILYFLLIADSFYQEYLADNFVYWGYPQWGWMYAEQNRYLVFNLSYLLLLFLCLVFAFYSWKKSYKKIASLALILPIISACISWYMPFYNWNRQFEIYNLEKNTNDQSRIPEGKWWVSAEQMQKYYDASFWERAKGFFGRGEWPGGYPLWGDYRVWLLPDLATDTMGRRGMVIHGGVKKSSPWGIDMGDNILDFAIQLRSAKTALPMNINYTHTNAEIVPLSDNVEKK